MLIIFWVQVRTQMKAPSTMLSIYFLSKEKTHKNPNKRYFTQLELNIEGLGEVPAFEQYCSIWNEGGDECRR